MSVERVKIFTYAQIEQEWFLRHNAQVPPILGRIGKLQYIHATEKHLTVVRLDKSK